MRLTEAKRKNSLVENRTSHHMSHALASLRDTTLPKFSLRQATSAAEWLGGTLWFEDFTWRIILTRHWPAWPADVGLAGICPCSVYQSITPSLVLPLWNAFGCSGKSTSPKRTHKTFHPLILLGAIHKWRHAKFRDFWTPPPFVPHLRNLSVLFVTH